MLEKKIVVEVLDINHNAVANDRGVYMWHSSASDFGKLKRFRFKIDIDKILKNRERKLLGIYRHQPPFQRGVLDQSSSWRH